MTLRVMASGALAAAPIALAACGGGGPSSKTLTKAADKTLSSSTFSAKYEASLAVAGQKGSIAFKGSGVVDTRSPRSRARRAT